MSLPQELIDQLQLSNVDPLIITRIQHVIANTPAAPIRAQPQLLVKDSYVYAFFENTLRKGKIIAVEQAWCSVYFSPGSIFNYRKTTLLPYLGPKPGWDTADMLFSEPPANTVPLKKPTPQKRIRAHTPPTEAQSEDSNPFVPLGPQPPQQPTPPSSTPTIINLNESL